MIPKVGQIIKVVDIPSYQDKHKPMLPVLVPVFCVDPYPYIVVSIHGKLYELYEDDGYEILNTAESSEAVQ